jgi:L-serine dehydratase
MRNGMMPSIFNDVIGPVMRGPSSSHTAASHRIGNLIRQLCPPENKKVLVEFDRHGSLATTYEGQGSAMGLISGLLGLSILDRNIIRYKELAIECGLNVSFKVTEYENSHPNTYKISVESERCGIFRFTAISKGGGMIEITNFNGFEVSVRGDFFETFIYLENLSADKIKLIFQNLKHQTNHSEIVLYEDEANHFLINIKSREPLSDIAEIMSYDFKSVTWIRQVDPVMPVLGGVNLELPFSTIEEMILFAEKNHHDMADLAIMYESARAGIGPRKVFSLMHEIVLYIKSSVKEGLIGTIFKDRILGHQSQLILDAEREKRIFRTPMNNIIANVTALMEAKSSMGIIVAAPTAGSTGVLGGAILAVAEESSYDDVNITRAFLAAGMIGVFIAHKYTFAAEEGGCQVECGAASGMTAAGLVQLMGGSALEAVNAASIALQNMLGLICDPVADRVEVPCLGKNILGAGNALSSANMSIAGFDPVIPLDEVIDAMKSVGDSLPASLRCTGLGGLSVTPAAMKLHKKLKTDTERPEL